MPSRPLLRTTYYWQVGACDLRPRLTRSNRSGRATEHGARPAPSRARGSRRAAPASPLRARHRRDGDPVTYEFSLSTDPSALPVVQASTATAYTLSFQYGTTFYWRAAARDSFGAVSATGVQVFQPVFRNSAPTVPANLSKSGTISYHGWSPSQSIFWQDSADADGDAFTYSVYFGTNSESMSLIVPASLGHTFQNLAVNTAYYYRVVATDLYGAASASPLNWVYYQFSNGAPQAFDPVGPAGAVVTRNANPSLSWKSSSDPDADPVTYRVSVGTSAGSLARWPTRRRLRRMAGPHIRGHVLLARRRLDAFGRPLRRAAASKLRPGLQELRPALTYEHGRVGLPHAVARVVVELVIRGDPDGDAVAYRLDLGPSTGVGDPSGSRTPRPSAQASLRYDLLLARHRRRYPTAVPTGPWASIVAIRQPRPGHAVHPEQGRREPAAHLTPSVEFILVAAADPEATRSPTGYTSASPSALAPVQRKPDAPISARSAVRDDVLLAGERRGRFGAVAATPVQSLLLSLDNSPPMAFPIPDRHGALSTRHLTAPLLGSIAAPDGDPLAYSLFLSSDPVPYPLCRSPPPRALCSRSSTARPTTGAWTPTTASAAPTATGGRRPSFRHSSMTRPDPLNVTAPSRVARRQHDALTRSRSRGSG